MTYEFSGLKTDGKKTMVVFNKAGAAPLEVEASDFAFSKFEQANDIGYRPRIDAVVAMIGANVDIVPPSCN
ncbi:MAG TPA: hypothetical protein VFS88_09150 [Micavibrio sp.]|nr:hypothetical protein [Micavibrio sp.]